MASVPLFLFGKPIITLATSVSELFCGEKEAGLGFPRYEIGDELKFGILFRRSGATELKYRLKALAISGGSVTRVLSISSSIERGAGDLPASLLILVQVFLCHFEAH